jgi:NAD(P)H dehydrogenase (quinone)
MKGLGPVKVSVIYYSQTGTTHALAEAVREGAEKAGAVVRLRRVRELAPREAIDSKPEWREHLEHVAGIPEAAVEDLVWADAVLLGTPTRFGLPASQLQQFIDLTGAVWQQGHLANKVYGAFVSGGTAHGGQESTLLAFSHLFTHWGGVLAPPGYTDPIQFQIGNPYGASYVSAGGTIPDSAHLAAARYQGQRIAEIAAPLRALRRAA